ncbi:SGNH/GDSL hydrolase family protein [Patescibacteria group bacterium]
MRGFFHLVIVLLISTLVVVVLLYLNTSRDDLIPSNLGSNPAPTPNSLTYGNPTIPKARSYRTVLVGDSVVASFGVNANTLREKLIEKYPGSEFVNYNYGYPATNVLSLPARLNEITTNGEEENPPILSQGFDLIIIESFGYNPLSEYPLEEGLQKQSEVLEEGLNDILYKKPNVAIAFMTPIAPSEQNFARGSRDLSDEVRSYWVKERIAYIDNHRDFALERGIPVIDVYEASLTEDGVADDMYISDDFIHPSDEGILLISTEVANYIYFNRIFPE